MVYIELLILEELIYNYIIILTVSIILNRITTIKKILLSSIISSISIIVIFYNIPNIIIMLVSFISSIIMSIISFSYKDIIYTLKNVFYMYTSAIFFAGFIYLINTTIFHNIDNYLFKVLFLLIASPIITYIYVKSIRQLKTNYSNYYKIDIYIDKENIITITSFLDTGNKLIDPYKHRPIILLKQSLIKKNIDKVLLVPYKTVSGESLLKCISPQKIYIHNIGYRSKVLIGLVDEISIEGADCILHQNLLERI